MRFVVSDNLELSSSFGKWKYSHDSEVRSWTDGDRLCLYFGYGIEHELDALITGDPTGYKDINGKFCVVVLWKDRMQVWVDYFCQTKVYYQTRDGLTITNHLPLLPLRESDVDHDSIRQFSEGWGEGAPLYACKDPMNMRYIDQWHQFSADNTVFFNVRSVPRDHCLEHADGKTRTVRVHDTRANNLRALENSIDWSAEQLQDHLHECMTQHSDVIKREYGHVCSSISEGIDSTLQDQYFRADTRLMYHPEDPNTRPELPPKQVMIRQYQDRGRDVQFDCFDVTDIGRITAEHATDPMLSYLDTVPTVWQVRGLDQRPDVLLYGQCADEMFMHTPNYLMARVPPAHRQRYSECYGGRKSPAREFRDPYAGAWHKDWRERFAEMAVPALYCRDIEAQTGVLTTSLYSDRRIFNLVHRMSPEVQLSSMAHVAPQRAILHDRFGWSFHTRHKDGAGYECRLVLKHLLTDVIERCLG